MQRQAAAAGQLGRTRFYSCSVPSRIHSARVLCFHREVSCVGVNGPGDVQMCVAGVCVPDALRVLRASSLMSLPEVIKAAAALGASFLAFIGA